MAHTKTNAFLNKGTCFFTPGKTNENSNSIQADDKDFNWQSVSKNTFSGTLDSPLVQIVIKMAEAKDFVGMAEAGADLMVFGYAAVLCVDVTANFLIAATSSFFNELERYFGTGKEPKAQEYSFHSDL